MKKNVYMRLACLLAGLLLASSSYAGVTVSELGCSEFGGDKFGGTNGNAINEIGHIAGMIGSHAGFIIPGDTCQDLGSHAGYIWSIAYDINDFDQVVGVVPFGSSRWLGFIWSTGQGMTYLDFQNAAWANGINNAGQVVGKYRAETERAFIWDNIHGVRDLGALPGGNRSSANDINENGETVGWSESSQGLRPCLWTEAGGMQDLGTLPGTFWCEASKINNAGQVIGTCNTCPIGQFTGECDTLYFIWTMGSGMQVLPVPGPIGSINDLGDVVGSFRAPSGYYHAYLWNRSEGTIDLGILVGDNINTRADGINNERQVVGSHLWTVTSPFSLASTNVLREN